MLFLPCTRTVFFSSSCPHTSCQSGEDEDEEVETVKLLQILCGGHKLEQKSIISASDLSGLNLIGSIPQNCIILNTVRELLLLFFMESERFYRRLGDWFIDDILRFALCRVEHVYSENFSCHPRVVNNNNRERESIANCRVMGIK